MCGGLNQPLRRGIRLKDEVPCARSEEDIAQEAVFLDNIRGRQPRDGADVSKDICPERLCGACGKRPSRAEDALDERRVPLIDDAVRCKRIRLDCVRACTQILRMDLLNDKRCFDVREFHALAARMRPLRVIRTHAAVKDERLFSYVFPYIDALLRHMYEPPCLSFAIPERGVRSRQCCVHRPHNNLRRSPSRSLP